jgi:hypothetical protein
MRQESKKGVTELVIRIQTESNQRIDSLGSISGLLQGLQLTFLGTFFSIGSDCRPVLLTRSSHPRHEGHNQ